MAELHPPNMPTDRVSMADESKLSEGNIQQVIFVDPNTVMVASPESIMAAQQYATHVNQQQP